MYSLVDFHNKTKGISVTSADAQMYLICKRLQVLCKIFVPRTTRAVGALGQGFYLH